MKRNDYSGVNEYNEVSIFIFLFFGSTRICAATWNVGGKIPPDDLDLDGLLNIDEPADVYVIG